VRGIRQDANDGEEHGDFFDFPQDDEGRLFDFLILVDCFDFDNDVFEYFFVSFGFTSGFISSSSSQELCNLHLTSSSSSQELSGTSSFESSSSCSSTGYNESSLSISMDVEDEFEEPVGVVVSTRMSSRNWKSVDDDDVEGD